MKEVTAYIGRSYGSNVKNGIAKLSSNLMKELNLKNGDIISINGSKKEYAKAYEIENTNEILGYSDILDTFFKSSSIINNFFNNSINQNNENVIFINAHLRDAIGAFINQEVILKKEVGNNITEIHLKSKSQIIVSVEKKIFCSMLLDYFKDIVIGSNSTLYYNPSILSSSYDLPFSIVKVEPITNEPYIINSNTKIILDDENITYTTRTNNENDIYENYLNTNNKNNKISSSIRYEDIGGLNRELDKIREVVELPLIYPELFQKLGIEPPKGILLYGPPGTGKTLIAKAIANETKSNFIQISGPEIISKYYGESENQLRQKFENAEKNAPSIIFIDEIDSIAPKRNETQGETERRIVAQLLTLMDGMNSRGRVIVIATTNRPDSIDEALRRGGRFDREIEIGVPDKEGRLQILNIHTKNMPLYNCLDSQENNKIETDNESVNLEDIAEKTHGYVGSDISSLCKEAAMNTIRRLLPSIKKSKDTNFSKNLINSIKVTKKDFEKALFEMEPSAMRELFIEVPNIKWSDIGGLENIKRELLEVVEWPLKYPKVFEELNIKPPKGILLYGPPGTGKTLIAKAIANECGANFIGIKGPELFNKFVGETEKNIRMIFKKAKQSSPTVIFFDEIDSIASIRSGDSSNHVHENAVSQILTEIDGVEELKNVVIIAATNRPDIIDPALLRPGRFDRLIYVDMPDIECRKKIFEVHLRNKNLSDNVDIDELSELTDGYVGADIEAVCREASMIALRDLIKVNSSKDNIYNNVEYIKLTRSNFIKALEKIKPSINDKNIYSKISKDFNN